MNSLYRTSARPITRRWGATRLVRLYVFLCGLFRVGPYAIYEAYECNDSRQTWKDKSSTAKAMIKIGPKPAWPENVDWDRMESAAQAQELAMRVNVLRSHR